MDGIVLDKLDEDTDVHVTGLDHLGEDEALCGRLSRHARGAERGPETVRDRKQRGQAYLFDISEGRLHDGDGFRVVVDGGGVVKEGRGMAERRESFAKARI